MAELNPMYDGIVNSPQTELTQPISDGANTIEVVDISVFPAAPNLAVIGTDEHAETIRYSAIAGSTLTGVTRAVQGEAKGWPEGSTIARNFTWLDQKTIQENIRILDAADDTLAQDLSAMGQSLNGAITTIAGTLTSHESNKNNPHGVTAAQVGADPAGAASAVQGNLTAHTSRADNPHGVTTIQLGAVPTSRKINDKPLTDDISLTAEDVGAEPTIPSSEVANYLRGDKSWANLATDVKALIPAGGGVKKLIAQFTASGTFSLATYGLPLGTKIDAYIVGGGAGGGNPSGGGGGYCKLIKDFTLTAASYAITVGAGGAGTSSANGGAGGSTTAFGQTVPGGNGPNGGSGGSGPLTNHAGVGGCAGGDGTGNSSGIGGGNVNYNPFNPYDGIFYGCGGGGSMGGSTGTGGNGGGAGGRGATSANAAGNGHTGGGGGGGYYFYQPPSHPVGGNGGTGGGGGGAGATGSGGSGGKGIVLIYA